MSSLQKEVVTKHLPPFPSIPNRRLGGGKRKKDYSPLPWHDFFDTSQDIRIDNNSFRIYSKGTSGPVLLLLHGGGHSALSWACFAVEISKLVECCVVAIDIRGHGDSVTTDDYDLDSNTLVRDVRALFSTLYKDHAPPTVLMGHSMGGAIAVRVASSGSIPSLVGLSVIDVVEGTAMESLFGMQSFIRGRPESFNSLEHAIEWSIRSGQLRNRLSARVSMVGQVKSDTKSTTSSSHPLITGVTEDIIEEDESSDSACVSQSLSDSHYVWRIDLLKTEKYWVGWFEGLSKLFLTVTVPKILILAGVDRLDKDLTIGQMQGKFQMQVLSGCGHSVHEDLPDKVAAIVAEFLIRHKLTQPKEGFERPFPAC